MPPRESYGMRNSGRVDNHFLLKGIMRCRILAGSRFTFVSRNETGNQRSMNMRMKGYNDYRPEIIGMDWTPGNLILVASRSWSGKSQYVLGNCIVAGTKEEIPVAYFLPEGDSMRIRRALLRLQAGPQAFDSGQIKTESIKELPLFFDDTPDMTIAHIVDRLFHLAETKEIGMAVIDGLQYLNTSQLDGGTKERELNSVLRILKAMAEALGIVIIVKSSLSDYNYQQNELPTIRDILDVTEAKSFCDQIILFHPVDILKDFYKMVIPFGHPSFKDDGLEMVLNLVLDKETGYFKKAESLYREVDPQAPETPMYEWYRDTKYDDWYFEFLDSEGMGWKITISPSAESENNEYDIDADNWAGDHINIALEEPGEDMEKMKAFALREARRRFPEVDIPEKG